MFIFKGFSTPFTHLSLKDVIKLQKHGKIIYFNTIFFDIPPKYSNFTL